MTDGSDAESTATHAPDPRLAARLFAYSFLTTLGYMLSRSLSDGLLLGRLGPDLLPLVMLAAVSIVIPVTYVWARITGRRRLHSSIVVTRLLLATTAAVFAWNLPLYPESRILLPLLYIASEVRGAVNTIQFAMVMNEAVRPQDRTITPVVAAGAPLAGIASGVLIGVELGDLTFSHLFWLIAALDLLAVLPVVGVTSLEPEIKDGVRSKAVPAGGVPPPARSLAAALTALVLLQVVVVSLVAYEWKVASAEEFVGREEELSQFFAEFYAICDTCTILLQLLIARRILRRRGIGVTLASYPAALLMLLIVGLTRDSVVWVFGLMTLAKSTDILRRALYDPVVVMLYGPIPPAFRRRVITIVNGLVKPLAEAAAVLSIFSISTLGGDTFRITILTALIAAGWGWVTWRTLAAFAHARERPALNASEQAANVSSAESERTDGPK